MTLSERVLRTVRKYQLAPDGARVMVALSGGPDSVALVHLLLEVQAAGALTLAGVAHFNHLLRGGDSDGDEAFCRRFALALDLPFEAGRGDVRALAAAERRSIEDAARSARYAFLAEAARRLDAQAIAVGHSLDDQAETFLLRLVRGAGPRGLAGILPRAGTVIRPLLEIRREELRQYLADRGIAYREDASNADLAVPRNRVRHELLPYLAREFSPGIAEVLAREAAIARDDEDRLQAEAIDLADSIVLREAGVVRIEAAALTSLHPALAARVARLALGREAPHNFIGFDQDFIGFDQIERFLAFARDAAPGAALSLPGQQAVRHGRGIVLGPEPPRAAIAPVSNSFRFPLSIPGEVTLDTEGWAIAAEAGLDRPVPASKWCVPIQASAVHLPLAVRFRAPGDRLRPAGMGGRTKKLQDLLVDRKVPRGARDSVPLVVDGSDRIVWVVGEAVADEFRATAPSSGVIFLKARRLGGLG